MSTSVSRSTSTQKRQNTRRAVVIVCSALTILLVGLLILVQGRVTGNEFAPSHFQTRSFSFHEIPFLHLQITPVKRSLISDDASRQIRTSSYITTPRGKPPSDWHIVRLTRGVFVTPARAALLTDELLMTHSGKSFWVGWNNDHPKQAAILWPIVQRLAARELYVLLPELLQLARTQPGPDDGQKLKEAIDEWLIEEYAALVVDMRQAERNELAKGLLDEALTDYPDAPRLTELAGS